MASNHDNFKPCNVCTRACFMTHGHQVPAEMMLVYGAPSFLQQIGVDQLDDNTGFLPLPTRFLVDYGSRLRDVVTWRGPSGWVGQVILSYDKVYGFRGGWKQFRFFHNIEAGDQLVCTMIADADFVVKIYDKQGCEKALPFLNSSREELPAAGKGIESAHPFELPNRIGLNQSIGNTPHVGEKRGLSISEEYSLSGMQKKLRTHQPAHRDSGAGNETVDMNIENQEQGVGKLPEGYVAEMVAESSDDDMLMEVEEGRKPMSENPSRLESEKSAEMEGSDSPTKEIDIHGAIYEAQVTDPLSTALRAALDFKTANPSTICVVNKTAASKSQSYVSSKFARRWLPAVKTQLLLVDELDRKWPVIFIPKSYHVVFSAGWAKFVRDNSLESGDVVLMELREPNSLTLNVHVFREERRKNEKTRSVPVSNSVDNDAQSRLLSTGNFMDSLSAGRINGNQSAGTSKVDTTESLRFPILPQYAAVAKYFSSRGSAIFDRGQKAGLADAGSVESRKPCEAEGSSACAEATEALSDLGKTYLPQQKGPSTLESWHERVFGTSGSMNSSLHFQQQVFQEGATAPAAAAVPDISYPPGAQPQHFQHFRPILPVPRVPPLMPQQVLMPNFTPTQMGGSGDPRGRDQSTQQEGAPHALHQEPDPHKGFVPSDLSQEVKPPPHDEQALRPQDKWEVQPRRRREPTETEKRRAMERALEFWTPNPHVISLLKPSQVYNGFSINLRSPALPDETRDATLLDGAGKSWVCKWLVNASGRRLSAGWKRFALDNLLEEYDVCVFEVVSRENLTMLVHIFRVELDDATVGSAEIKPIIPPSTTKRARIRKSRAKVPPFGRPPPDRPEVGESKPDGSVPSSVPGADALPTASSQRYPTPQSPYPTFQSHRRPVTMAERKRAEMAARTLQTANPSVVVVLTRSCVYCHFTVSIPSVFAKQWLPKKLVGVTLVDSAGFKSTARWAGNRKNSACLKGFKAFSRHHRLEEGDTLVFELVDSNPDNVVFLIHVFRVVELSDSSYTPHDSDKDACELLTDSEDDSDSSLQTTRPADFLSGTPSKSSDSSKLKERTTTHEANGESNFVGKGFCADVLPLAVRMPKTAPFKAFPVSGETPTHEKHEGNQ